jgi:hypothetical protein
VRRFASAVEDAALLRAHVHAGVRPDRDRGDPRRDAGRLVPRTAGVLARPEASLCEVPARAGVQALILRGVGRQAREAASGLDHVDVWLDGTLLGQLSQDYDLGADPIGAAQIGDNLNGRSYDVVMDDLELHTNMIAP